MVYTAVPKVCVCARMYQCRRVGQGHVVPKE
jgi:hypothetical protein